MIFIKFSLLTNEKDPITNGQILICESKIVAIEIRPNDIFSIYTIDGREHCVDVNDWIKSKI